MNHRSRIKRHSNKRKFLSTATAVLVLLGLLVFGLEKKGVIDLYTKDQPQEPTVEVINFDPPTELEQQAANDQKQETEQKEAARNNTVPANKTSTSVIITDAAQYDDTIEVRAFIPNHYEDGTCTITFSQGSKVLTKTTPAYRDVSTTICTNPLIERSEFSAGGEWDIIVRYDSTSASGQSSKQKVTLQ